LPVYPPQRLEPGPAAPAARPRRKPAQGPAQPPRRKLAGRLTLAVLVLLSVTTGALAGLTLVYSVDLPQINDLERYRASTTTDLYDRKGRMIGSFALERREIVGYSDFAPVLRQAVISIEDKSFASHWGINIFRVAGAAWHDLRSHGRAQGASTLTMQLARNLFLSADRTPTRKIQEAYLAIQIERAFTKEQIFTLYGNQIYLGHGQYGFEAASEFFFSKHARDLTLPEAALLAGLPKGPVAFSPILYPEKALRRRNLVLSEMENDGAISRSQAEEGRAAPLGLQVAQPAASVAPWFQEDVRRELEKQFGSEEVHEAGLKVQTTLDLDLQQTANRAVADGLAAYERRKGWAGKLPNVLDQNARLPDFRLSDYKHPDWAAAVHAGDYAHALVTSDMPLEIQARVGDEKIVLLPEDWKWTGQRYGTELVKPGDLIYVRLGEAREGKLHRATLEQDSGAEGSLMAMDNATGDVLAMVGGRDYATSQFNRATQAERQTGSSFKPYVYTAAIEDGARADDIVVDAPVAFGNYTPHDYEGNYLGAMTLVDAFAESRNIPALKLAARVGMHKVIEVAHRFGVTSNIPAYLPVALGAVEITLDEQVASYAVFPNDGIRVAPRLIRKVSNADGINLWEDAPAVSEVISQPTARTMMTLLRAVMAHGTGGEANELHHPFGGKTGTTSDFTDAWFLGFSPSVTCGVWVGYDSRQSLGDKETGARAALPIWMTFMKAAIVGKDSEEFLADTGQTHPLADTRLKAAADLPAKPAGPAALSPAPIKTPAAVVPAAVQAVSTNSPALSTTPALHAALAPPTTAQVKPAITPAHSPAQTGPHNPGTTRPVATVKPAIKKPVPYWAQN
jgi:penicillin-binding protein 1A